MAGDAVGWKGAVVMRWIWRMAAVIVGAGAADVAVVLLVPHPLPWAALVPACVPLLTVVFVIIPMRRALKAHGS